MKTGGGVIGISQQTGALNGMSRQFFAVVHELGLMMGSQNPPVQEASDPPKEQLSVESWKDRDGFENVNAFLECLEVNLFMDKSGELVSLFSGIIAPRGVKDDLLLAYDKGQKVMVQFFEQDLLKNKVGFSMSCQD